MQRRVKIQIVSVRGGEKEACISQAARENKNLARQPLVLKNMHPSTLSPISHLDGELPKGRDNAVTLTSSTQSRPVRTVCSTELLIFVLNNCSKFYPKLEIYAFGGFLSASLLNFYLKGGKSSP